MRHRGVGSVRSWRGWDWLAPAAAALGLLVLVANFVGELHDYRRAVVGWAARDLKSRTALAAATLAEPLATSDFRRIHAFGDACAEDGVRLTVFSGHGGVFFDSLRAGAEEPRAMYAEQPCGEFTVRLGLPYARVLAPVEKARRGLLLAGCLGGFSVLVVFFFTYRQRVRIRELARLEEFRRAFIADVSHEIKTPLTGILGAVDLLEDGSPLVPLIRREAKRLNALVQSILDLSRLDDDIQVAPEPVDLRQTAIDALVMLRPLAGEKRVAIHSRLDDGCVIMATVDDIFQIIFAADDVDDLDDVLTGEGILELQNSFLLVLFADADVFLQSGHTQVVAALFAVLVGKDQVAQGVEGGLLNHHVVDGDAAGVIVVEADKLAVQGNVDVGFNAVVAAIACGDKGGMGVFQFQSAAASMGDHLNAFMVDLDRVHVDAPVFHELQFWLT